ncbi:calcium permeable stress-gated cation channel 1-like [Salvia miltiorrhiza]|uniref:calcium permeable stress-gated cation channel 1-like n=1 Tax=Salvia miltiorrhiza TaxID=226208 RepID=UPI0025ACA70E|nr:calcium permeable stress-gated cation channel 1-like [Salvia miltiorrhiza]
MFHMDHPVMAYVFTLWTCYALMKEYEIIATMRFHFLASEKRRPDQFTARAFCSRSIFNRAALKSKEEFGIEGFHISP